jgi:small GTP-binding protein
MRQKKGVLVGDSGVGKTCIYTQLSKRVWLDNSISSVTGSFCLIQVQSSNGVVSELGLWDTAGQECYRALVPAYFEKANFIIAVYSVDDLESFKHIPRWLEIARRRAESDAKIILIGNKSDVSERVVVEYKDLSEYGESIGAYLAVQASAKTGAGFEIILTSLGEACAAISPAVSSPIEPAIQLDEDEVAQTQKGVSCCR